MKDIIEHQGVFRRQLTVWQGAALISSATIGAGVLGIPYVIAQVGVPIGVIFIIAIGLLMIGINELVGSIALESDQDLQLVGYAQKYLGNLGGVVMTALTYVILFGALVVYLIGEGVTLAALFGGDPFWWSLGFFVLGSLLIYVGISAVKTVEFFLTILILAVVLIITAFSVPHVVDVHLTYSSYANLLLPYGVLLFAYHGTTSIPEVKVMLSKRPKDFKKAIRIAGVFAIIVYLLFTLAVVGVTGAETTEIATIGLGQKIGPKMVILGNVFAVLAMGTSFLMAGLALRDSLRWDYNISKKLATCIISVVPLVIFVLGIRQFIAVVDIVGGVFISTELFLLIIIYLIARRQRKVPKSKYLLHHVLPFAVLAMIAFTIGAIYSVTQLF